MAVPSFYGWKKGDSQKKSSNLSFLTFGVMHLKNPKLEEFDPAHHLPSGNYLKLKKNKNKYDLRYL